MKISKRNIIAILIITLITMSIVCGCISTTPKNTTKQVQPQNTTIQSNLSIGNATIVKHTKIEGSFTLSSNDFVKNASKTLAKDGHGNVVEWKVEDNSSGGFIKIKYYEQEVSAYVPRLYYPANQTYSYVCNESGYEITAGTNSRYKDIIMKGDWNL